MKAFKISMVALVAVAAILPALNSPAEARYHRYNRVYNSAYANPYGQSAYGYNAYNANAYGYNNGYGYGYSPYRAKQAAANQLINQVNAAIQAGQITVQQGNQMLIQGHM